MNVRAAATVFAAAISLGLFAVVGVAGELLPLPRPHTTDPIYYFIVGSRAAAIAFAAGVAIVLALWLVVRDARRLLPLCWTAPVALGIVAALPNIGSRAAVLAYFLYHLRFVWLGLIAMAMVAPRIRWRPAAAAPSLWIDAAIVAAVCTWAIGTMPILRFTGHVHGDEPKYLRYSETLYQGQGFDIDAKKPLTDYRADADSHLLGNVPLLGRAVAGDVRDLAGDLAGFAHDPIGFRWNRAIPLPNWFLTGKHGNAYQVHTPGLSFLLLPGYYLDRHVLSYRPGYQGEFPADLVMTNVAMLTFHALAAVALFRLLWGATGSVGWSASGAVLAMITLPSTSFAFQLYPETPAALIVLTVTTALLFRAGTMTAGGAVWIGAAVSYLVWLHPRFLFMWLVFAVIGAGVLRARPRRAFLAGVVVVMFAFCAYAYHLTGSWMPTAMYDADPNSNAFVWSIIPVQMIANMIDRIWGVVPHAPILLALPAGVIALWRRRRAEAIAFTAVFIALLIPTASHGLSAAGATPGRQFMAVIPLAFWPLTRLAIDVWPSVPKRALLIVLSAIAVETAWTYNFVHEKAVGRIVGESAGGWRPNIAFPWIHTEIWDNSSANFALFLAWLVLIAAVTWWLASRPRPEPATMATAPSPGAVPATTAGIVFAMVVLGTAATAAGDDRTRDDYLPMPSVAHRRIARALVDLDRCRLCTSSAPGRVDWWLFGPNPLQGVAVAADVEGQTVRVGIELKADRDLARTASAVPFARAAIDFGDGTKVLEIGVIEPRVVEHAFNAPGRYVVSVSVRLPKGELLMERRPIVITP